MESFTFKSGKKSSHNPVRQPSQVCQPNYKVRVSDSFYPNKIHWNNKPEQKFNFCFQYRKMSQGFLLHQAAARYLELRQLFLAWQGASLNIFALLSTHLKGLTAKQHHLKAPTVMMVPVFNQPQVIPGWAFAQAGIPLIQLLQNQSLSSKL